MGRPPTVCSDVPSTSRTAGESGSSTSDPPPYSGSIPVLDRYSGASTSKQTLAETTTTPLTLATEAGPASDIPRPVTEKTRRTVVKIDSTFEEYSDDSYELYRSSDEELEPTRKDRKSYENSVEGRHRYGRSPHEPPPPFSSAKVSGYPTSSTNEAERNVNADVVTARIENAVVITPPVDPESGGSGAGRESVSSTGGGRSYGHGSRTFCFGLLLIHSTFFTLFIFDLLLLSHTLVFTVTNYLNGPVRYHQITTPSSISDISELGPINVGESIVISVTEVPYNMLLPLFAIQIFWLVAGVAAVIALKLVQPLLQLPYMLISILLMFTSLWLIARCVVRLLNSQAESIDWILMLTIALTAVIFAAQFYFLYIKLIYTRALLRKRNAVVSSISGAVTTATEAQPASAMHSNSGNNSSAAARPTNVSAFAAAIEARIFRRQRSATGESRGRKNRDKCNSSMTITTIIDEKSEGLHCGTKRPVDADCCSCASCCCDETYSTKSTIIVTDDNEQIYRHKV